MMNWRGAEVKNGARMLSRVVFSRSSDEWGTPEHVYKSLDDEFHFDDDPCPIEEEGNSGLLREWGKRCFINPPYSDVYNWIARAHLEHTFGRLVVLLVPSRTDTRWWHKYAMEADEIRFIKGRLRFGNAKNSAPFPSAIVIFRGQQKMQTGDTQCGENKSGKRSS